MGFLNFKQVKIFSRKKLITFKVVIKKKVSKVLCYFFSYLDILKLGILFNNSDFDNNGYHFTIVKSLLYLIKNEFTSHNIK